jgi:flavin reductase (DIM6/NTAB) family NADH-FMN oxidoreductase RutF
MGRVQGSSQAYQSDWAVSPITPGRAARSDWNRRAAALRNVPVLEEAAAILESELEAAMRAGDAPTATRKAAALANTRKRLADAKAALP